MRMHCFISTTSRDAKGARWTWHIADAAGVSKKFSEHRFASFNDCVDDARAHGYFHVEVPVLDGIARAAPEGVAPAFAGEGARTVDAPALHCSPDQPL